MKGYLDAIRGSDEKINLFRDQSALYYFKKIEKISVTAVPDRYMELYVGKNTYKLNERANTWKHSFWVSRLSYSLAKILNVLGLRVDADACARAGLLHDIGKYSLPPMRRPQYDSNPLSEHVNESVKIAKEFGEDRKVLKAIRDHHSFPSSKESLVVKLADMTSMLFRYGYVLKYLG